MANVLTASRLLSATLFSLAFVASVARAGVIVIATDDPDKVVAKKLSRLIETTPPFSRLPHLQIKVVYKKIGCPKPKSSMISYQTTARAYYEKWAKDNHQPESAVDAYMANLMPASCKNQIEAKKTAANLERTFVCDNKDVLQAVKKELNGDLMIYLNVSAKYGGSGGPIPMASTTGPITLGLHELLHTVGFDDEYGHYTACEADLYCHANHASVNVFEVDPAVYASETDAREKLKFLIPWYSQISPETQMTNESPAANGVVLGTANKSQIGLFPAKTCDLSTAKLQSWRSTPRTSVMESLKTNYIPEATWPTIALALKDQISSQPGADEKVFSAPSKSK